MSESGKHGAVTDPLKHVAAIADLAKEHGFTVGAAESLTGGAVSSALARGAQAAMWFHGGIVSYSRMVKYGLLGVSPGPLVSEQCALEMVEGAGRELLVDAAVSTTGAGGPDAEEGHPPGTLYVGVLVRGQLACHKLRIEGDPGEVVESATEQALGLLLHAMSEAVDRIEAQPEEPARDLVS
jgi:nicotinamide-nucleotide amidase